MDDFLMFLFKRRKEFYTLFCGREKKAEDEQKDTEYNKVEVVINLL